MTHRRVRAGVATLAVTVAVAVTSCPAAGAITPPELDPGAAPPIGTAGPVQPMAQRLGLTSHDGLHHFVSAGRWDAAPLEAELLAQADHLVGGPDAYLVIDDTALPKKGTASVGVAPPSRRRGGDRVQRRVTVRRERRQVD